MENLSVERYIAKDFVSAEAFKVLRTNLQFCGMSVRVVGITSFNAAEGKSSVSFQLAASLAQTGKRVVLLDTDLRKSYLQSGLKVQEKISFFAT